MFDPGYYNSRDLNGAGFASIGENVLVAKNCTIIGIEHVSLGDNVRVDGYTTIIAAGNGRVAIGNYVHIGAYCMLSGGSGITMHDFSGLSQGVRIYSKTDDYSGYHLTNPTLPEKYLGVTSGRVELGRHVIVGSGSVILPGATIGEGSAIGALSLVTKDLGAWGIYFGAPARLLKKRAKHLLELEAELLREISSQSGPDSTT